VILGKNPLSNKIDEMPFAQRIKPIKRFSFEKYPLLFFSILIISFSIYALFVSPGFQNIFAVRSKNRILGSTEKVSLLGHLPYPEAAKNDLVDLYPGLKVHKDMHSALLKMKNAASSEGIELVFLSGFRSINLQEQIFYENKSLRNQIAIERAKVSAPPGYSEHSTGYAIDIGDRNHRETDFEVTFESTPAFRWLEKNAAKYHFVLSFPKGNFQGVSFEPWHWRFEGTVNALKQFDLSNKRRKATQ
tara:strand:+ start:11397 stop:12134 length:738 start_codon:yes stop_codon:yes gene_type:complete